MREVEFFSGWQAIKQRWFFHAVVLVLAVLAAAAHAAETVVYEKISAYGPVIVSQDENGARILRFEKGGARQSQVKLGDPDHLELAYVKSALAGLALSANPRRFLVIGLGGATLPMFLRKHYPDATIDAVDINPDVVHVAKEYFGFSEDAGMRAHVDDGRAFIERVQQPYDVVFLDAYGSNSVPEHLTTQEFLRAVRRALKPDGVVVGNVWGRHVNPLYEAMVRTYQEVFDDLYILDVRAAGNMILLGLPRTQSLSRGELAGLARRISTVQQWRFDLGEVVNYGFLHATAKNPRERVLRDALPQK